MESTVQRERIVQVKARVLDIVVRLLSPLSHGGFGPSTGNAMNFRRVHLAGLKGNPAIPAISGNSLRGVLRRIVMRDLIQNTAISATQVPIGKWDKLYAAIANGGHLTGSESRVDPQRIKRLRENLPPLSLFGAALYTWMLPGHFSSGWLWPRCKETVESGLCTCGNDITAEGLIEEIGLTRHIEREFQDPAVSGVTPMPTTVECLSAGTVMEGRIVFLGPATEIEQSCVAYALDLVHQMGGKGAGGLGRVSIEHQGDPEPYKEWLASHGDSARDALIELANDMGNTKVTAAKE